MSDGGQAVQLRQAMTKMSAARTKVDLRHPLVGTWKQAPNRRHVTTVVCKILVEGGKFKVSAIDSENGVSLKISGIKWDGTRLRFESVYPPTRHRANHALTVSSNGRMCHEVSGVYADSGPFAVTEIWIRKSRGASTRRKP